ncbi:S1/P1 nuclease, partial [Acinetobacter baumannii]
VLALLAGLLAQPALAWGSLGHRTVAAIAWANVQPQTRGQLAELLRQARVLNTPECAVRTLADASTWADCVRKDGDRFRFASRWHF